MTNTVPQLPRPASFEVEILADAFEVASNDLARSLRALVVLDPVLAAGWLLRHEARIRENLDSHSLTALVDDALAATVGAAEPEAMRLAHAFVDCASAGVLAHALNRGGISSPAQESLLARALDRFPAHAGLLRMAARAAVRRADLKGHAILTRLARTDATLGTLSAILRDRQRLPPEELPPARVALLSSFTLEPLVPYLDLEFRELGFVPQFYVAGFNRWTQELLDPNSPIYAFAPELTCLAISADDLIPALADDASAETLQQAGDEAVAQVLEVARGFSRHQAGILVVHTLVSNYRDPGPVGRPERSVWLSELNRELERGLSKIPRVYTLDLADVAMRRAGGPFENVKMRHLAGLRLAEGVLPELASAYARFLAPVKGLTRKCVVLDLDNTLWGGVVGEDGPGGIRLGHAAPGSEFREFQRYLKGLTGRGFLLAINSKNNPEDALQVIRDHDAMILRETDFSAIRINWLPKPENMRSIAQELNIGLNAFVFLDDKAEERALMRHVLPEVLTPELPADPSLYRTVVERLPQLQTLEITQEDRARVSQYRAEAQRRTVQSQSTSVEGYYNSLGLRVAIARASDGTLTRVHQLFQRTNQFNVTTRRYSPGELAGFSEDPACRLYVLRAADRFGDHGLVGTALVRLSADEWLIDSFLVSCRALGCGVESALLAAIVSDSRAAGARKVVGEFLPTPKNIPAKDFYSRHGFGRIEAGEEAELWCLDLSVATVKVPVWIQIEEPDDA